MEHITFENLGISPEILQALEKKGYGYPTEIQEQAIPPLMEWKDVIAKAPTGTGKTVVFSSIILKVRRVERSRWTERPVRVSLHVTRMRFWI